MLLTGQLDIVILKIDSEQFEKWKMDKQLDIVILKIDSEQFEKWKMDKSV